MLLPNIFMEAFREAQGSLAPLCELSVVKIKCFNSNPENVKKYFINELEKYWNDFWKDSVGYDENDENDELVVINQLPIECSIDGCVVIVHVDGMISRDEYEMDVEYDDSSLEQAIFDTKNEFADIECEGFVITDFSNESYGEVYSEEISADGQVSSKSTRKIYPELGEVLLAALSETGEGVKDSSWAFYGSCSDEVWDYIESNLDDEDCKELFKCFKAYSKWTKIEFFEKLQDLTDDEELAEKIEKYIDRFDG